MAFFRDNVSLIIFHSKQFLYFYYLLIIRMTDKNIILRTKKPFCYYLTIILLVGLFALFSYVLTTNQYNIDGLVSLTVIFLAFGALIYVNFGQHLATISFSTHRLEINYIFPWNKSIVFEFDKITTMDYKELHFSSFRGRWNVGGNWLMLKNERGEICQFKYSINDSDDNRLVEGLRKICTTI